MRPSFSFGASSRRARQHRRWVAIAGSLGLHIALVAAPGLGRPGQLWAPAALPLTVRLEHRAAVPEKAAGPEAVDAYPAPAPRTDPPARGAPTRSAFDGDVSRTRRVSAFESRSEPASEPASEPLLQPHSPDYYTAQELDVYPSLRQPLQLDWQDRDAPGAGLTALVTLDETGAVEQVAILEATVERAAQAAVHGALAVARFSPALKEGRAVKSRIVLRIERGVEALARVR